MNEDLEMVLNKLQDYLVKHRKTNEVELKSARNQYDAYLNATFKLIDLNEKNFHKHLEEFVELKKCLEKTFSKLENTSNVITFFFLLFLE